MSCIQAIAGTREHRHVYHLARIGLSVAVLTFGSQVWGTDSALPIAPFNAPTLEDWKERSFSGNSQYDIVDMNGVRVLKGSTNGAASLLYKEKVIDLTKTPILSWSWQIQEAYEDIDEHTREGDDFPARLYVVARTGRLPWQTLAINYVWSSNQEVGSYWPNPFTRKAQVMAVQSGNSKAGQWVTQNRDVRADFKTLFGRDIDEIAGYAVMVDGDNAGKAGTAWFADINFVAN